LYERWVQQISLVSSHSVVWCPTQTFIKRRYSRFGPEQVEKQLSIALVNPASPTSIVQVCCPPVIIALLWCRSALLGQSSNAATTTKRLTLLLLEVTLPSIATSLVQMLVCDSFDDGSSYLPLKNRFLKLLAFHADVSATFIIHQDQSYSGRTRAAWALVSR